MHLQKHLTFEVHIIFLLGFLFSNYFSKTM